MTTREASGRHASAGDSGAAPPGPDCPCPVVAEGAPEATVEPGPQWGEAYLLFDGEYASLDELRRGLQD